MIVLVIVSLAVVAALAVANVRLRRQVDELSALARETTSARDAARTESAEAAARARTAEHERDAAMERVRRARRDAAEVARRLQEVSDRVAVAEQDRSAAESARAEAERSLEASRAQVVAGSGEGIGFLWDTALAQVDRLWHVSVSPGGGAESPLASTDDPLRSAVEIVVDAAREEAGAPIELDWRGGPPVGPPVAPVVLALVQELVAAAAEQADAADIAVDVDETRVAVRVDADGSPLALEVAADMAAATGKWCVPRR